MNDGNVVADSSALLAALKNEPFSNIDPRELVGATISAVNLCEVLAKLLEDGLSEAQADAAYRRWICASLALTSYRRTRQPDFAL